MKTLLFIFSCSFLLLTSCTKNPEKLIGEETQFFLFQDSIWISPAEIIGTDYKNCDCCGGFEIYILNKSYRFTERPSENEIDLSNPNYPIEVVVHFKVDENGCTGDEIIVYKLEVPPSNCSH